MTFTTGDNNFSTAKFIVNPTAGLGTHTTITSALASAVSGNTIFIMPSTYTENLTLKAGVNLVAYPGDEFLPNVTIIGKCTFTAVGTVNISNIRLQTNSDFFLAVTGANASVVNLENCYLNVTNNTGISFTITNTSSSINLNKCIGDIAANGITLFSFSGTGTIDVRDSNITNSGLTTTNSTCSAGGVSFFWSTINFPITISNTGTIGGFNTGFGVTSTTPLTLTNSPGHDVFIGCEISGATNSAISIGAACVTALLHTDINSSNANALTGAGTLEAPAVTFSGTSFANNVTTIQPFPFGLTGTFTPSLAFGGSSVGITYTARIGKYWLQGEIVFYDIAILLSNKGAQVGNATITGLPFTSANDAHQLRGSVQTNITMPAGCTVITGEVTANTSTISIQGYGSGTIVTATNAEFANNSLLLITGFYWAA